MKWVLAPTRCASIGEVMPVVGRGSATSYTGRNPTVSGCVPDIPLTIPPRIAFSTKNIFSAVDRLVDIELKRLYSGRIGDVENRGRR